MAIFFRKTRRELKEKRLELDLVERLLAAEREELAGERTATEEQRARLQQLLASRVETYPHIAQAWADWEIALAS